MTLSLRTVAMFPGQGSQSVGMGKAIFENFAYTRSFFEEASDAVKVDLKKLCFEGPEDALKLTANTQPTILLISVATWQVLAKENGFKADAFMGHSLGEYSALVASGRLAFVDAIKLVRRRGEAMQRAVPEGKGAMSAVMSVDALELEKLCKESSVSDFDMVQIANYNSSQQLVVAGSTSAVERLEALLTSKSSRFVRLQVSAPFHSKLMGPAKDEMKPLLEATNFLERQSVFVPNLTADLTTTYSPSFLVDQIDHSVKWTQSVLNLFEAGTRNFVEVGPGKVLVGLMKRILPKGDWTSTGTDDLTQHLEKLKSLTF